MQRVVRLRVGQKAAPHLSPVSKEDVNRQLIVKKRDSAVHSFDAYYEPRGVTHGNAAPNLVALAVLDVLGSWDLKPDDLLFKTVHLAHVTGDSITDDELAQIQAAYKTAVGRVEPYDPKDPKAQARVQNLEMFAVHVDPETGSTEIETDASFAKRDDDETMQIDVGLFTIETRTPESKAEFNIFAARIARQIGCGAIADRLRGPTQFFTGSETNFLRRRPRLAEFAAQRLAGLIPEDKFIVVAEELQRSFLRVASDGTLHHLRGLSGWGLSNPKNKLEVNDRVMVDHGFLNNHVLVPARDDNLLTSVQQLMQLGVSEPLFTTMKDAEKHHHDREDKVAHLLRVDYLSKLEQKGDDVETNKMRVEMFERLLFGYIRTCAQSFGFCRENRRSIYALSKLETDTKKVVVGLKRRFIDVPPKSNKKIKL